MLRYRNRAVDKGQKNINLIGAYHPVEMVKHVGSAPFTAYDDSADQSNRNFSLKLVAENLHFKTESLPGLDELAPE